MPEETKSSGYFCEFEIMLKNIELTKSKLPSEYKNIFQGKKRIEKLG
jgi:hypothetical protein